MEINQILKSGTPKQKRALFQFNNNTSEEEVILKFNLWSRYFFPRYFTSPDASFHKDIDKNNLKAYRSELTSFVDVAYRGAAKTARTKLFIAYVIANDENHFRKYIKVLSADGDNSIQITTDIYNMLINIGSLYPELFEKSSEKREERMSSFTTSTGIKMKADTVGTSQRGAIQEDARQDFIWFEDFENRATLRSAVKTKSIADNMEEARTGLAVGGSCIYTCNYISEAGNVHTLINKKSSNKEVLIVPIMEDGKPTWERYSLEAIEQMKKDDDDFWGERMCKPSASKDVLFNRESIEKQKPKEPKRETAGFKIYKEFDPSHRIGSGHDVAGGVGLDSSTSVFIDFDTIPAQVCATFESNEIKPEAFGFEIKRETDIFGGNIAGIENNKFDSCITIAKQQGVNLYCTEGKEVKINQQAPVTYGWNTNTLTKPKMLLALSKAVEDGLIELNDPALIAECKGYTRNDLIENVKDPRLTTRHFDLLIGAAIAWQMKDQAFVKSKEEDKIISFPHETY